MYSLFGGETPVARVYQLATPKKKKDMRVFCRDFSSTPRIRLPSNDGIAY